MTKLSTAIQARERANKLWDEYDALPSYTANKKPAYNAAVAATRRAYRLEQLAEIEQEVKNVQ